MPSCLRHAGQARKSASSGSSRAVVRTRAPSTMSAGMTSEAGHAFTTLPPMVARLRIWTPPTCAQASASSGSFPAMSGCSHSSASVQAAPISTAPSRSRTCRSSSSFDTSTSVLPA